MVERIASIGLVPRWKSFRRAGRRPADPRNSTALERIVDGDGQNLNKTVTSD